MATDGFIGDFMVLTRRAILQGLAAFGGGTVAFGGYALAEPWRLHVTRYRVAPPNWPALLPLKLAIVTDLHVCEPWLGVDRLEQIVARTNALGADAILLLGDYRAGFRLRRWAKPVADRDWAGALAGLKAPLGVHAVLGNHDWWDEPELQITRRGPTTARLALEAAGIPVYENDAVRLAKGGHPFWLAGLGDQWAFYRTPGAVGRRLMWHEGVDDLPATLAKVSDGEPVILMAHEPDIFPKVPTRVALTVSGHTHGGQVRVLGYSPIIPSAYGRRYLYGHVVEEHRNLIVSGGLGCSGFPVRFGVPPEIVLVEVGAASV